jgi:hypothetical protein
MSDLSLDRWEWHVVTVSAEEIEASTGQPSAFYALHNDDIQGELRLSECASLGSAGARSVDE